MATFVAPASLLQKFLIRFDNRDLTSCGIGFSEDAKISDATGEGKIHVIISNSTSTLNGSSENPKLRSFPSYAVHPAMLLCSREMLRFARQKSDVKVK